MKIVTGFTKSAASFSIILLVFFIPCLVFFNIQYQWNTPSFDFFLDYPGSATVHSVISGGKSDLAGIHPGDVLISIDGDPVASFHTPRFGFVHTLVIERQGVRESHPVVPVSLLQMNFLPLASSTLIALAFWGIGTLLLVRRFQNNDVRLLFLIFQICGAAILFPVAYQSPWTPPVFGDIVSKLTISLLPPLMLQFISSYPARLGNNLLRAVGFICAYILAFVIFLSWVIDPYSGKQANIFFTSFILALSIALLTFTYRHRANPETRRRIRIIGFCTIAAISVPFIFYLVPLSSGSSLYLPEWFASSFLVVIPVSYLLATLRYNLFGIDRIVNRTLVYVSLSLGILIIYLIPYFYIYQFLPDDLFIRISVIFVLTIWIGWTFDWLRTRTQRLVDKYIYGGWYDFPAVVETISNALAKCVTRDQVNTVLTGQVPTLMRLTDSTLWIRPSDTQFPSLPPLRANFRYKFQTEIQSQWTVGSHTEGDELSETDLRILHTVAKQAEIALNNALTIETLQNQLEEILASREALARTQRQLLRSREEERSRLARDLHDSPIQALIGMNIQMGLLLNSKDISAHLRKNLEEMRSEVRKLSDELRQVCADLRPPMLDTLGLSSAIRSLASEWTTVNGIKTQLNLCPDQDLKLLPGEVAVNLFRVAQEALSNIAKHAHANRVDIFLSFERSQLVMTIEDDGTGFNAPDTLHGLTQQSHYGLAGMRERMDLIGGSWSIKSAPGKGTIVRVVYVDNESHAYGK